MTSLCEPITEAKIIVTSIGRDLSTYEGKLPKYFRGQIIGQDGMPTLRYLSVRAEAKLLGGQELRKGQIWSCAGRYSTKAHEYGVTELITANTIRLELPSGDNFIRAVAENPDFNQVGRVLASKLWVHFGRSIYELLDRGDHEAILSSGLFRTAHSANIIKEFCLAWQRVGTQSTVLAWLDDQGIDADIGHLIAQFYKEKTEERITEDPYRVCHFGVPWRQADALARGLGVDAEDRRRLDGAFRDAVLGLYAGEDASLEGNTVFDRKAVKKALVRRLGDAKQVKAVLSTKEPIRGVVSSKSLYAPEGVRLMERYIAERIRSALQTSLDKNVDAFQAPDKTIAEYEQTTSKFPLTAEQRKAVALALTSRVCLISGGAGTGKTTVLEALCYCVEHLGGTIFQMALAGRAARRMEQATGRQAYTIDGFLYHVQQASLIEDIQGCPITPFVIVDEASMVDLVHTYKLLRRLPSHARLILVGDEGQLPPIGPGLIFHKLIKSERVPVVQLKTAWRFKQGTDIPKIAATIREGIVPKIKPYQGEATGVSLLEVGGSELCQSVVEVYQELGGNEVGTDGVISDTQILCSVTSEKESQAGTQAINRIIQKIYTSDSPVVKVWDDGSGESAPTEFREGDFIMFTVNDSSRNLYNGTLGRIIEAFDKPKSVMDEFGNIFTYVANAEFDAGVVALTEEDIKWRIVLSYGITIHKSQGSQFGRVVIPLVKTLLLDRTLLYTAVTRAKEQVIFVGESELIRKAVERINSAREVAFRV